ncbi:MAG: NAD(P)/FAD-dependent oxidoreductase [Alphaproteobacteria bacterium]|jgi:phytoene dehydrogenase-like protein|nr:NAD(P)/FAD-dependent oxidoreductase [Alphaproteobacteria bacterium]MBT4016674.1 NAD(P)/FAD-dependent oxidoreductase [Alphaproteobacteria bacterium]MBT4967129.1 NAD(P)/FAD-dependent oxidoreductase [Alphaproteobacteria bacterium]MBT5158234.1 NAD(P)/FAD-dependent oxidoreductase [Alphaproteobacteria bacterium]MBT5917663.1 NAD(P)/FAD-dependent oxidoreductase [Alphaproteobacteria bacterium]
MTAVQSFDVVIIGAGHNGLVTAGYLAKKGLAVKVVERRGVVGGAAVTEEFHPGFRNSVCAYTVSLLNPKVVADLDLYAHGLKIVERPVSNFLPTNDAGYLHAFPDPDQMRAEVARHSTHDADQLADYEQTIERLANVLKSFVLETPPNSGGGLTGIWKAIKSGKRLYDLSIEDQRDLADIMTMSAVDFLDRWFENDAVKALFAFDGIVGTLASPYQAGTAYVLLHHCFGEIMKNPGAWGHAIGGMGAITQAMARSAQAAGADIEVDAPVAEVLVSNGKASGVRLEDGREIQARVVAANVNPKLLFGRLLNQRQVPQDFYKRMMNWRCASGTFRMNVALRELPDFSCLPGTTLAPHHTAGIILAPDVGYMENAYIEARQSGWSKNPVVEMLIPSTIDPTLAPEGCHVASLFCQHFDFDLPGERNWDDEREAAADCVIEVVNRFAPNFSDSVIARQILSPLDLEREFGLIGGDIFHGTLDLNQLFSLRPILGYADYRMPVKGLYLCGSGAHPGGGVTGAPGHNAAREILRDLK